jgi:hypothetical protein
LFFLRNQQAKSTMIHSQCQIHHCWSCVDRLQTKQKLFDDDDDDGDL